MRVLAIESSCDETAAAIVRDGRWVEGNVVASQIPLHQQYGGVVPEVASRAHVKAIVPVIREAMAQAEITWTDLDVVVGTHGPGLTGSLLIGLNAAKAIAYARDLPFIGINHLEGHIYANWLASTSHQGNPVDRDLNLTRPLTRPIEDATFPLVEPSFPLLCLVVSGGHSDIVLMRGHGDLVRLGRTRDDAAGEAFDKVARILGLGFPGGPAVQQAAASGDPTRYPLPRAWLKGSYDFSFSGLKTAVLHLVRSFDPNPVPVADVCAAFQAAVADVLTAKAVQAAQEYGATAIALAGGVAANSALRIRLQERSPLPVRLPPLHFCTDNAAMIASAGYFRFQTGARSDLSLDVSSSLPIA